MASDNSLADELRALAEQTDDQTVKSLLLLLGEVLPRLEQRIATLHSVTLSRLREATRKEENHYTQTSNKLHSLSNFIMGMDGKLEELAELLTSDTAEDTTNDTA